MHKKPCIRVGARGSALAQWQAKRVEEQLLSLKLDFQVEIIAIKTSGDMDQESSIDSLGGKGVFIKEVEQALAEKKIDIAVHSFKDITQTPDDSLSYSGFILEERQTDAFILFSATEDDINVKPMKIATGSLRRKALCNQLFPLVKCIDIRGNVETRIKKAKDSGFDGLILSTAGLQRLNLDQLITFETNPEEFVPAPGQGIIALQHRNSDTKVHDVINLISNETTNDLAQLYFDILKGINFNCTIPLGVYINQDNIHVFVDAISGKNRYVFSRSKNHINDIIKTIIGAISA